MQPSYLTYLTNKMNISQRLALRKKLDVSASEFELLELIRDNPNSSLSQMADALGLSKKGIDKACNRLVEKGHLAKTSGKLSVSKNTIVELSTTTYTVDSLEIVELSTTIVEQSTTPNNENVEQSTTIERVVELSTTENEGNSENRRTKYYDVEQSTTITDDEPHTYVHGGSSNNINLKLETLKEEKNKENKINPLPPDKNKETKKEARRAEWVLRAENRVVLNFFLSRKGKRLKCLPKPKKAGPMKGTETWSIELRAVFNDWLAYKTEKRSTYRPKGLQGLVTMINKHPPQAVISAIQDAISKNYQGFFPDNFNHHVRNKNNKPSGYGIGQVSTAVQNADSLVIRVDELGDIEL